MKTLIIDSNYKRAELLISKLNNYNVEANQCPTISDAVDSIIYGRKNYDVIMINQDEYEKEQVKSLKSVCSEFTQIYVLDF